MRVLRLCSVYGSAMGPAREHRRFDVIGGMQVHTSLLTAALDGWGVEQTVVTAYRPGAPRVEAVGERSRVVRTGLPIEHLRQLFGIAAIPEVARTPRVDLVHVHVGEDLAVMPLAWWAAMRTDARLVVTVHCSLRHTLVSHDLRSRVLRSLGGSVELHLLRSARAVLVLSDRLADRLETSGVPRAGLHVVPLGIRSRGDQTAAPSTCRDGWTPMDRVRRACRAREGRARSGRCLREALRV